MKKQKRQKYSNGSVVIKKDYKNVGAIEGKFQKTPAGDTYTKRYSSGDITGSLNLPKNLTVNASVFRDSEGQKNQGFSINKQLNNQSDVSVFNNRHNKGVSITKGNWSFDVTKPKRGSTKYGLKYSKSI